MFVAEFLKVTLRHNSFIFDNAGDYFVDDVGRMLQEEKKEEIKKKNGGLIFYHTTGIYQKICICEKVDYTNLAQIHHLGVVSYRSGVPLRCHSYFFAFFS